MRLQVNTMLALYSVIEFATDPQRHIPAAEIAEKYSVSPHHLAKVLAELARAGIVESVRGVGGGYRFTANVRRLTLMDVIQLFEDFAQRGRARFEPRRHVVLNRRNFELNPLVLRKDYRRERLEHARLDRRRSPPRC